MTHPRIASLACLILLTACTGGGVKETLGLESRAPDEFRVVSRPPLSVPPQFTLRPPAIGASSQVHATDKQAEALITGRPQEPAEGGQVFLLKSGNADTAVQPVQTSVIDRVANTSAESQLLKNAGAEAVDPTVRTTLVEEKIIRQEKEEELGWWEVWSTPPEKKDPLVSAREEAERIKKNQEEGKPASEGEVATTKQKDRGILGRILGD